MAVLVAAGCVLSGDMCSVRALVLGDSDQLSFEWSRETRMPNYRRFQCVQDQEAASRHVVETLAPGDLLPTVGGDLRLRFLSGRRVVTLDRLITPEGRAKEPLPRRFAITAGVGTYVQLGSAGRRWIEDHCALEAEFGQYCFYRVKDDYPEDLRILLPSIVDAPAQPLGAGLKFNTR